LFGTILGIHLTCLAKSLPSSLQGCFVNLPVALDEIYWSSTTVGKGSDLLGALVHPIAMQREKALTKTVIWLVVIPKPLVRALLLSALHPCS
jgi:hypothetical protein